MGLGSWANGPPKGFGRGLPAEKIIGLRRELDGVSFLVKWKGEMLSTLSPLSL